VTRIAIRPLDEWAPDEFDSRASRPDERTAHRGAAAARTGRELRSCTRQACTSRSPLGPGIRPRAPAAWRNSVSARRLCSATARQTGQCSPRVSAHRKRRKRPVGLPACALRRGRCGGRPARRRRPASRARRGPSTPCGRRFSVIAPSIRRLRSLSTVAARATIRGPRRPEYGSMATMASPEMTTSRSARWSARYPSVWPGQ
jgi:hypothetical protein